MSQPREQGPTFRTNSNPRTQERNESDSNAGFFLIAGLALVVAISPLVLVFLEVEYAKLEISRAIVANNLVNVNSNAPPLPSNKGSLVATTNQMKVGPALSDLRFGITIPNALVLERKIQYCQWEEQPEVVIHRDSHGNEVSRDTTYYYKLGWYNSPLRSESYKQSYSHKNPTRTIDAWKDVATECQIGSYTLTTNLCLTYSRSTNRQRLNLDHYDLESFFSRRATLKEAVHYIGDGMFYFPYFSREEVIAEAEQKNQNLLLTVSDRKKLLDKCVPGDMLMHYTVLRPSNPVSVLGWQSDEKGTLDLVTVENQVVGAVVSGSVSLDSWKRGAIPEAVLFPMDAYCTWASIFILILTAFKLIYRFSWFSAVAVSLMLTISYTVSVKFLTGLYFGVPSVATWIGVVAIFITLCLLIVGTADG